MSAHVPSWLGGALGRTDVTDLLLNGTSGAWIDCGDGLTPIDTSRDVAWSEAALRSWVLEQVSAGGRTWDARHPFIDATLPSGHRMHVAFPPLARQGLLVSLRRLPQCDPAAGAAARWAASPLFSPLREAVRAGESVLISGATGSGKTTLATDLLATVPFTERILALEDTPELAPAHPHFISLISRPPNADGFGEVTLRTLLKQALRMRPDRIVLGECRGAEVMDLLQALNTGHRGGMATLHANSARDALRRVELLCLLAAQGSVPIPAIRELLASGVRWVAHVRRGENGRREIAELNRIEGREGDVIVCRPWTRS